jgi:GNAT superfamily N-acetyltransferase
VAYILWNPRKLRHLASPETAVQIDLLPCSPDDRDFVLRVTEEAMRAYVEEAFGSWDADVQRRHLEQSFDPATYSLIMIDEVRAGILVVEDRPSNLFLAKIFLLPEFQRRGVGTVLIRRLIECAKMERKPLGLRVLRVNAAARRLYARLGFAVTRSTADHDYLEHHPKIL